MMNLRVALLLLTASVNIRDGSAFVVQQQRSLNNVYSKSNVHHKSSLFVASSDESLAFAVHQDNNNNNDIAMTVTDSAASFALSEQSGNSNNKVWLAAAGLATAAAVIVPEMLHQPSLFELHRGWTLTESITHLATSVWHGYESILEAHPLATKAVTSATVYTIGDVIAQKQGGGNDNANVDIDYMRTTRSMLAGLIGHGPLSHYWYIFCDNFFENTLHITPALYWWSFLPKVALDQSLWGPIWNSCYIIMVGLMKGGIGMNNLQEVKSDITRSTVPLLKSGLKLWVPAHFVTYGLIPVQNRLLWVDTVEILWVMILANTAAGHGQAPESDSVSSEPEMSAAVATKA